MNINKNETGIRSPRIPRRRNRLAQGAILLIGSIGASVPFYASAQSPSPYVDHVVPSALKTQVDQLAASASTQADKLRAATLEWALNQATFQFSSTNQIVSGTTPWVRTASFLAGDTTTTLAPSGVAPSGTYDLQYSPLGIGDLLVADVQANLAAGTQLGMPNNAQYPLGYDLFPNIPNYPIASNGQRVNFLASGIINNIGNVITSGSVGLYDFQTAQAFGHPDSPYYGDSRLVPIIFDAMEKEYDQYFVIANGSDNFPGAPALGLQYLLVAGRFPSLILPSVQKRWEASIYHQCDLYYKYNASSSGITSTTPVPDKTFLLGDTARAYPNADFRVAEFMYYASAIFTPPLNHNNYPAAVATNLRSAVYSYFNMVNDPAVLFPDGAFTYVYGSNEVGTYQGVEVGSTGDLFMLMKPLTGAADVAARSNMATILENARLYYPMEYPSKGFAPDDAEYPAFKHHFNAEAFYEVIGMLGTMHPELSTSTDPQVWRTFNESLSFAHQEQMNLLQAACVDTSKDPFGGNLTAAQATDPVNYFLYDQNRQGPNIRVGLWTMFGSARMNRNDVRGQSSVVGFQQQLLPGRVKAGLDCGGNVVFTGTDTYINTYTSDAQNSTIVRSGFASLVTKATMRPHSGSNIPFAGIQEWIYTPTHLIGLSTLVQSGTSQTTAYGVGGMLTFEVSSDFAPASGPLPRLQLGLYSGTNYAVVANVLENTYGNFLDTASSNVSSGALNLRTALLLDVPQTTAAQVYKPGVIGHYVVDIHPNTTPDITAAKSVNTGIPGLYALEVKDGGDIYRLVHNTTGAPISYTAALSSTDWGIGSVFVHHAYTPPVYGSTSAVPPIPDVAEIAGETYRPGWVDPNGQESYSSTDPTILTISGGAVTYTIPANSHIVLTKSLPSPYLDQDIGSVGLTGSAGFRENDDSFAVVASGSDIWAGMDAFHFVYKPISGDCTIIARVASVQNANAWSKAGVMIRETLAANSRFAGMYITPGSGAAFQYRSSTGSNAQNSQTTGGVVAPCWVKLVRVGNVISGYRSPDGVTWTQQGTSQTVSMASAVYVGLPVCAHNNAASCAATFTDVTVTTP